MYYAKKLDEIINKEDPDRIILLGDLYYHGPRNALTEEYNPSEVAKILNKYAEKILCTKGNCDAEVDEMISDFKFESKILININGVDFFFSHGHIYNSDNVPPAGDVIVYGHFHTGFIKEEYGLIFTNPGSISLPKNNTAHFLPKSRKRSSTNFLPTATSSACTAPSPTPPVNLSMPPA